MIKRLNPLKQVRYKSANAFKALENLNQQICRFVDFFTSGCEGAQNDKRERVSRACYENNVLCADLGNCVRQNIGNPLSLNVCKLTLLELEFGCTIVSRARLDLPWVANACLASV